MKQNPRQIFIEMFHMFGVCKKLEELYAQLSKMRRAFVRSTRCFQDGTEEVQKHGICDSTNLHITPNFQLPTTTFSSIYPHSKAKKSTFCSKIEFYTEFRDFLASKLLWFYQIGTNDFVNSWEKSKDFQKLYFK